MRDRFTGYTRRENFHLSHSILRAVPLLSLLILLAAPVLCQDFTIEPGRNIGKIELGADRLSVHKILGKPTGTYKLPGKRIGDYWISSSGNSLRIFYESNRAVQISITSPRFATPERVSTKSSLKEVEKIYKSLKKSSYFTHGSGGGLIDYYDDIERGIAFEFTSPDSDIPDFKLYAILIHLPGKSILAEPDEKPR
jgi:hypothetical protein